MGTASAVTALFVFIACLAAGLGIIASGQLFLAVREIALNTRKEESAEKSTYSVLLTVAKLNNLLGWLVIIAGAIFAALLTQGGSGFGSGLRF